MKWPITVVFLVLFAGVAFLYYYLVPSESIVVKKQAVISQQLLVLEKGDKLTKIRIEREKEKSAVLVRQDDKWSIEEPVVYPADPLITDGLGVALLVTAKERKLLREKDWSEYGLANPTMKIGVQTQNHPEWKVLAFGDKAAYGNFVYARWEGEEEYFLVTADLKKAFDRSLYSLRYKRAFRTPLNEIRKIRVKTSEGEYEFTKQDAKWYWMEPVSLLGEEARKEFVDDLLLLTRELAIKDFLDNDKRSPSLFGISSISPSISVWNAENKVEFLRLGKEVLKRDSFLAQKEGEDIMLLVARGNVKRIFEIVQAMTDEGMKKDAAEANPLPTAKDEVA